MWTGETRKTVVRSFQSFGRLCGLVLIFAATASTAQALPLPEIDPGSASLAVATLASGFFLFTASRRRD
jgi:hypothetical protein